MGVHFRGVSMATVDVKTQKNVTLNLATKLGNKGFALQRLTCNEGLSELFETTFDLIADDDKLKFKDWMGKPLQVTCEFDGEKHYFEGVVGHIAQRETVNDMETTYYRFTLFPQLWLLKFTQTYWIFQKKSVKEILKEVLKFHNIKKFKDETKTRGKEKREYCVQYGESDYDFLQRLMEEEGISFHFNQEKDGHTLIFTDSNAAFKPYYKKDPKVEIQTSSSTPGLLHTLLGVRMDHQVIPKSYTMMDYNFKTPTTGINSEVKGKYVGGEMVEYPAQTGFEEDPSKAINKSYADMRLEEQEAHMDVLSGGSTFPGFHPGKAFTLKGHTRKSFNGKYVLRRVRHVIEGDMKEPTANKTLVYKNDFESFPADCDFRPPRQTQKPHISSTQTATVTGPKNKEIYTDKYGRVKVRFHWDPEKKGDEKSSCWVRVGQNWSDKGWGFVFIPRIGQEVILNFLNGDPDRPIITGCVYNGTHMPPYLPKEPTKSTIKTQSIGTPKGKPKGSNELRFEDKYEKEEIYLHAEKDWNTVVNETRTTLVEEGSDEKTIERGDRVVHIKGDDKPVNGKGDDLLTIDKGSRTEKLLAKGKGKGNYTVEMKEGTHSLTITKGDMEITIKKGNRSVQMDKGNHKFTIKSGNETITIDKGNQVIAIKNGKRSVFVKKDEKHTNKASFKQNVTKDWDIKVTGNASIKATGDLDLEGMNINMKAKVALKISAAQMAISVKGPAKIDAGMLNVKSKGPAMMEGAIFKIESKAALILKAGAAVMVKGPTVMVKADAAAMTKGAIIMNKSSGPFIGKGMPVMLG